MSWEYLDSDGGHPIGETGTGDRPSMTAARPYAAGPVRTILVTAPTFDELILALYWQITAMTGLGFSSVAAVRAGRSRVGVGSFSGHRIGRAWISGRSAIRWSAVVCPVAGWSAAVVVVVHEASATSAIGAA
jgi:hypothetical protein